VQQRRLLRLIAMFIWGHLSLVGEINSTFKRLFLHVVNSENQEQLEAVEKDAVPVFDHRL
jgi:hypothetical protein